jgi:hypothetical protein
MNNPIAAGCSSEMNMVSNNNEVTIMDVATIPIPIPIPVDPAIRRRDWGLFRYSETQLGLLRCRLHLSSRQVNKPKPKPK